MKSQIHKLTKANKFQVSKHLKSLLLAALFIGATSFISAQSNVAHINKEELIKAMPAYTAAQGEITKLGKTYEAQIQDSVKELDAKLKQYNSEAEAQTQEENQKQEQTQKKEIQKQEQTQAQEDQEQTQEKAMQQA